MPAFVVYTSVFDFIKIALYLWFMNFDLYKRVYEEFNDVVFYDDTHEYFSDGIKGISVTGLKEKFLEPFNEKYWALYKTIQAVFGRERVLSERRKAVAKEHISIDGNQSHYLDLIALYDIEPILGEWKEKSDIALFNGSRVHKYLEDGMQQKVFGSRIEACDVFISDKRHYIPVRLEGVCASKCRRVFGQYDGLFYDPQDDLLELADYKTDEEISFVNNYKTKMLGPLSFLDECNGNGYIVQLNLYREFLEAIPGLKIGRMRVYNVRESEGMYIPYDIPRMDLPFERMVNYDHSRRNLFSTRDVQAAY